MRPMRAVGFDKVRIGNPGDGGYVHIDDFHGIDRAFSLGIENNVAWDLEIASRNIKVEQYDFSVAAPPVQHPLFQFHQTKITTEGDGKSLDDIVDDAVGASAPDNSCILKMDIEHWEWPVLQATGPATLRKFRQIVAEFHCFNLMGDLFWWQRACAVFRLLNRDFALVHIHANNIGSMLLAGGVPFPNVLELTFASRSRYDFLPSDEMFPTPLDYANGSHMPDIFLGRFEF